MIEIKQDNSVKVTELMGDFRQKLIEAAEDPTNKSVEVVKLEKLEQRLKEIEANPTPQPKGEAISINSKAGYTLEGNIATFIRSKTKYSIDSNGTWRRISKKMHEV